MKASGNSHHQWVERYSLQKGWTALQSNFKKQQIMWQKEVFLIKLGNEIAKESWTLEIKSAQLKRQSPWK